MYDIEATSHNGKSNRIVSNKDDIGLQFLVKHGTSSFTAEEERKVKWKLDLHMMPIMMITYGLQYVDKVAISYAAVYNMRSDLGFVGQNYSWATSIFYFGYLAGQIPANYLIQRYPIGKFAAASLLIWGTLVMLLARSGNFAGMATLRFLIGFFESGITPAWTHMTSMFYTKREQGARCTVWFSTNGFGAVIGGILSYGIGYTHTAVAQWQLLFLILGAFTIFWAFVVFLFLPDSPTHAKFLSERERCIAVERLRTNRTGVRTTVFKVSQAVEALRDPQVWILALTIGITSVGNVGGSFLPIIIQDMGFTGLQTTLLTLPAGGVQLVSGLIVGLASSFTPKGRTLIMFFISVPNLLGSIFLAELPRSETWIRISGSWLLLTTPAAAGLVLSLIGSNVAGFSKKITTMAFTSILYCVGNIVSPQLFISSEAPAYETAMRGLLASISLCLLLDLVLCGYYLWENGRRHRVLASMTKEEVDDITFQNEEYADRTDREDFLKFRYSW